MDFKCFLAIIQGNNWSFTPHIGTKPLPFFKFLFLRWGDLSLVQMSSAGNTLPTSSGFHNKEGHLFYQSQIFAVKESQ